MAEELGVIQQINVNAGTRQVDRSGEARALAQGLDVIARAGTALATDKAGAEMEDALIEGIQESAPEMPVVEEIDPTLLAVTDLTDAEKAEAVRLANDIRRAEASIKQASGVGQRNIAIHKLRTAQREMKKKFGVLGANIDAVANTIITTSPELMQLSAQAAEREAHQRRSQDYLDRIAKEGYEVLEIPTKYEINSPEFVYEYQKRSTWRDERVQAEQRYSMLAATGQWNSVEKLKSFKETAFTEWSPLNANLMLRVQDELQDLNYLRMGGASPAQMAQAWDEFTPVANEFRLQVLSMRRSVEQGFANVWAGEDTESKEYKGAVAVKAQVLDDLDMIDTMLAQGDVKIGDYIKTQQLMRAAGILEQVPSLRRIADVEAAVPGIFDTLRQLDVTSTGTAHLDKIARGVIEDINTAGIFTQNSLIADPADSAAERDAARQAFDANSQTSGTGTTSADPTDRLKDLADTLDKTVTAFTSTMRSSPETFQVPGKLDEFLLMSVPTIGRLYDNQVQNRQRGVDVDITEGVEQAIDWLSSDDMWFQYKELDPAAPGRASVAHAIENQLMRHGNDRKLNGLKPRQEWYTQLGRDMQTDIYGKPFSSYLEVQTDKLASEDRIVFRVNETAVAENARKYLAAQQLPVPPGAAGMVTTPTGGVEAGVAAAVRDANRRAQQLARDLTRFGRMVAMRDPVESDFTLALSQQDQGINLLQIIAPEYFENL